ncbi:MAG: cobalamin biosynthesis protein [Sporichthyaceae bacterium]
MVRAVGIALGVLADAVFADPRRCHPVAGFGRAAGALERRMYRDDVAAGARYAVLCVGVPLALGAVAERRLGERGRTLVTAGATWAVLGGTSLGRAADLMARHLETDDLPAARARLRHLCARDPSTLQAPELARATVESVAENTSDAVVAPLFWGAVAGVPGLLGYRAVNTLDAMVGYRNDRYERFGKAAARLDDVVNLVPARLTGLLTVAAAPLVGGSPAGALRALRADRRAHPSPNAGWCEAAAAGALGVRLGGTNSYPGYVEERPTLNATGTTPQIPDVRRAMRLARAVGLGAAVLAVVWSRR